MSLPANLESVAETWKRLAPSFWVPIASEFFFKTWRNAYLYDHDLGHTGKLEANLDSFKTPFSLLPHPSASSTLTTISALRYEQRRRISSEEMQRCYEYSACGRHAPSSVRGGYELSTFCRLY